MKGALRAGIIAAVVVLLLAIALIVLAAIFNFLLDLLYITLIVLAAFSLISTGFLIYTMLLLIQSIVTVRNGPCWHRCRRRLVLSRIQQRRPSIRHLLLAALPN